MLTKGQKIYMYVSALFAMLIGIVTFIPFRTLPFLCTLDNVIDVVNVEMIIKLIVFPIVVIALSAYANIKKYQEIEDGLDRSKVVNVMSYFPIVNYLVGLVIFILHTLSYNVEPLGFGTWALVVVLLLVYLAFLIIGFHLINKLIIRLENTGTIIFDSACFLIVVCFILVAWRTSVAYAELYQLEETFVGKGDPILFFVYIITLITFIVLCKQVYVLIKKDNRSVYINRDLFERNYELLIRREYNRAYNDIMDDFELYFAEHYGDEFKVEEDEVVEEKVEEVKAEEPKVEEKVEEVKAEEPKDEEKVEEVKAEEPKVEEKVEEVKAEEPKDEEKVEEVKAEEPKVEEVKTEEPKVEEKIELTSANVQPEVKEDPKPKPKKNFKPSYREVVAYGSAFKEREIKVVANEAETVHKFYLGKKLFLITQSTNNDYRITFLSMKEEAIELIMNYPGVVVKATSPKGQNWFKLVNKNEFDRQVIKDIIIKSLATLETLEEQARIAREEALREKREAAKKAKEEKKKAAEEK